MAIHEKLLNIQSSISVPKNQYNKFGKYVYRSCEDILSALKPLLKELKCTVTVNDDLVFIGNRYYIRSTVTLIDFESGETVSNQSYAREEETKKGMDASQITGTASSYARKYALNGLLLLDDIKDADTNENQQQNLNSGPGKSQQRNQNSVSDKSQQKSQKEENSNGQGNGASKKTIDKKTLESLKKRFEEHGIDEAKVRSIYKVSDLSKLSVTQYANIIRCFEQVKEKCTVS